MTNLLRICDSDNEICIRYEKPTNYFQKMKFKEKSGKSPKKKKGEQRPKSTPFKIKVVDIEEKEATEPLVADIVSKEEKPT